MKHNHKGNCWDIKQGKISENDVCKKHDEPRGSCSVCPRCILCDKAAAEEEDRLP